MPDDEASMAPRNKLLAKLARPDLEVISPDLEPVELALGQTLHEAFGLIEHAYFIERGVASMVNEPETGDIVEFATIGPEGMVGFPVLLGRIRCRAGR